MADQKLLEKIKACFKLAHESEADQRKREDEDIAFQVGENQWSEAAKKERQGGTVGNTVIPPRPMLSISLLHQPMQLVQNQAANAQLGVNINPVSEEADDDLAEVKQGLYRRIERDSNAVQARLWALDRAKQAGRGWYRINTQWDDDGDDPWDQEIVIERLLFQEMVYMDPSAQRADYSDAKWGFVAGFVPIETFRELYPKAEITSTDEIFKQIIKQEPLWATADGEKRAVLVAEYFYKVEEVVDTLKHADGRMREIINTSVKWCKATGTDILEKEDWNGRHIPLVPVIGRELQPIAGERRWEGMIRQARDSQRFYNAAASTMVERMFLEPKAPFILAEGQDEGHEAEWAVSNTRNLPYLTYKPTALGDKVVGPPVRSQVEATGMNIALMAMQEGKNLVQSSTAIYDPSLGRESSRDKSGRAIMALQQQADAGTSHYIWNLANISMPYEAKVILDLMPAIYDRPGRITRVLGGEDDTEMVMLGQPYVMDPKTGRPTAVPEGTQGAKFYDLSKGKYSISVNVGKSYQTRLQEGSEEMGQILQAAPELMPVIGATYFRFRDFPGAKEIADILKQLRERQFPGLGTDKNEQPTAEEAQAKAQALQQQLQLMQAELQAAIKAIETDVAKQQASIQIAQMNNETKERIAAADNETKLAIEGLAAQLESMQALLQRSHETAQQHKEMAHDVAMAHAGGTSTSWSREGGQEQEGESEEERSAGRSSESTDEAAKEPKQASE